LPFADAEAREVIAASLNDARSLSARSKPKQLLFCKLHLLQMAAAI
jgi:hypothetical protein